MAYCNIVNKTKHNFKTKIGNEYTTKDVLKVWNCISEWIENNIIQDKGVLIKGIGYFTVARWELNGSKVNPCTIRKPVFLIDEKLANDFNLKRRRAYNLGTIPERYFNVLTIAQNFKLNIDMVNHCFKEVVVAFRKLLFENKNCELPFPKIGKLRIKNKIVTMKYYEEFLERQNKHFKNRMVKDKKNKAVNYNPDWDADQYESRKRPCSAMSTISRPASSLSQYRPGTGYEGVLPNTDDTTDRPNSRQSVDSNCIDDDDGSMVCRPGSRLSVRSNTSNHEQTTRPHSRPASSLSQHCSRPGTGNERVLPNTDGTTDRLSSRLSAHPDNGDENEDDITCRPDSRLSVRSKSSQGPTRPQSRSSLQSACRPLSSVQSARLDRSVSRSLSCDEIRQTRPRSRTSKHNRPSTGESVRSVKSNCSMLSKHDTSSSHACHATKLVAESNVCETPEPLTSCVVDPTVRPCSNLSKSKLKEDNHGGDGKNTLIFGPDRDETLCHSCNVREYRLRQIDNMYKPDLSSVDNRNNFMKGDNPINGLLSTVVLNKRKDRIMQISNYNYNTAKELLNENEKEKKKNREEKNESFILKQRPSSIANLEQRVKFKRSLLEQIENNKIKKERDNIASLECDKLTQKELLKSLYDERMRNIEAKNRSKENYLIILNEHLKNKSKFTEEEKKKDKTIPLAETFIFGPDQNKLQKLNNSKHRQIANYQLKQKDERNLELREEKEKNIDFERSLLNRLKEKDEILQRYFLQKKLNQKKFLSEDLNKLFGMSKSERRKNEVPGSYPMSFPLKSTAKRCRKCKKNGLEYPFEKITDFMY